MTYAFTFDASACTGCKACQIACKDKNNLPEGVLWRRVYEISGGSWQGQGEAWTTDVFAYNLSLACNHCVHPKCAGVCPTDAYVQREDGIVFIDESKCMGCGYCAWACPYSAPRYNPDLGYMTKCNLCFDNLDADLPPACVAACPMRVLDLVKVEEQSEVPVSDTGKKLWTLPGSEHPFPLPVRSRTEPHLAIQSHSGMGNDLEKSISNWEEINTGKAKNENPLVAFTLSTQMAVGIAMLSLFSGPLSLSLQLTIGGLIGIGGLISILHLGRPLNAWRAPFHLKKSWLSREILMFGLFGASWVLALLLPGMGKLPLALCGLGLLFSMTQVYRLRSIQPWDTNRTLLSFVVSTLLLGSLGLQILSVFENTSSSIGYQLVGGGALVGALWLTLSERDSVHPTANRFRLGLIALAMFGTMSTFVVPHAIGEWMIVPVFVIAFFEETLGRWLFYEQLHQRAL